MFISLIISETKMKEIEVYYQPFISISNPMIFTLNLLYDLKSAI